MFTRNRRTVASLVGALLLSSGALAGCASSDSGGAQEGDTEVDRDAGSGAKAADTTICAAEATPIEAPYAEGFPTDWAFPPQTTVYGFERRDGAGVIVTGISTAPFDTVLAYLNDEEPAAGYTITGGETEEDDAEADFMVADYAGRWTIRASASCEGETVVQVVAFTPKDPLS